MAGLPAGQGCACVGCSWATGTCTCPAGRVPLPRRWSADLWDGETWLPRAVLGVWYESCECPAVCVGEDRVTEMVEGKLWMFSLQKSFLGFCFCFLRKTSVRMMFSPLHLHLFEATFIFSSSTFQERGKDFGRLYRARTQNALNTASVAEEQEEMRRVFADGCDCQNSQVQG